MTEPIYEVEDRGSWAYVRQCGGGRVLSATSADRAAYLCELLNANPFPEDPPRYEVVSGESGSWVRFVPDPNTEDVAWFSVRHYPDHGDRARAEAARLNRLEQ